MDLINLGMKVICYPALILFFLSSVMLLGQGRVEDFALSKGDLIEDLLFDYYDEKNFNGAVLVVENNKVIYENTFGFADFENEEPLDRSTPFYLASLAKQFTAAAIVKLAEDGQLSLDDPLRKYLPLMPKLYDSVKIRHLLTHTSGVPDYFYLNINKDGLTNLDVYKGLIEQRNLDFTPGNKYKYSNSGYVLLAMVIQVASGQTIDNYFNENIFKPFHMENSFVCSALSVERPRVKGYTAKNKLYDYNLLTVGDGGIYATSNDMYKWQQALNNGSFISAESLKKIYEPVVLTNGRQRNYGFGWEIGSNMQGKLVYHTGGLAGFRTYIERQIETNNAIIIFTNNSFTGILDLRNTLVKILDERYPLTEEIE